MTFEEWMNTMYLYEGLPNANGRERVLNEQGMTYHNDEYDVVIERIPEIEVLMYERYPDATFFAYYSNAFTEEETTLEIYCEVKGNPYVVTVQLKEIPNGSIRFHAAKAEDGAVDIIDGLVRPFELLPGVDDLVLSYLAKQPAYRLYLATTAVKIKEIYYKNK